jgi:hypothetical protein
MISVTDPQRLGDRSNNSCKDRADKSTERIRKSSKVWEKFEQNRCTVQPEKYLEVCLLLESNPENRCRVGKPCRERIFLFRTGSLLGLCTDNGMVGVY